ncbi:MAG: ketoacyl-ACP synthase III [Ardenticatenales bacterium]|nr:ketoacyl-ACP synthase III [Ardenticatenales bacterium]
MNPLRHPHVIGWGASLPSRVVTNDDVCAGVDSSDAWIRTRTGIVTRHVAAADESTETLAVGAARDALATAGLVATDIDLIICATNTFDVLVPNLACTVQRHLGARAATAFDVQSACSGFVFALSVAMAFLRTGPFRRALVIGAETMSRVVDWTDRNTCVLFGDGAGAVVVEGRDAPGGIVGLTLGSDGAQGDLIVLPIGLRDSGAIEGRAQRTPHVEMAGHEVFRFAVRILGDVVRTLARDAGIGLSDIDLVIPHQANLRILEAAAKRIDLPPGRMYARVKAYGNTSAASVPLALADAVRAGAVRRGDRIALVAYGGGLSWGGCLIEWTAPTVAAQPATSSSTHFQEGTT